MGSTTRITKLPRPNSSYADSAMEAVTYEVLCKCADNTSGIPGKTTPPLRGDVVTPNSPTDVTVELTNSPLYISVARLNLINRLKPKFPLRILDLNELNLEILKPLTGEIGCVGCDILKRKCRREKRNERETRNKPSEREVANEKERGAVCFYAILFVVARRGVTGAAGKLVRAGLAPEL
ncbi:hypothetical protein EVAR_28924_1 [Eumeta japonica]|uniref:Uncharacterized protein n=1 Tax=Eumeta variegata TaxID=151549 RepID=A0A4C1YJD2_EUMVA|nr:hypothetical protein EVAR_28924_1 [Eumeta japonica]